MPNTPAMVGQAMSALVKNDQITDNDLVEVDKIFKCIGKTQLIDESMMDAVIGVSGSSPAYVFMFIEAMADAAVLSGMPRDQAYQFCCPGCIWVCQDGYGDGPTSGCLEGIWFVHQEELQLGQ